MHIAIIVFQLVAICSLIYQERGLSLSPEDFLYESFVKKDIFTANLAFWFNQKFILEAVSLMFIGYKMALVLRINRGMDLMMSTIENAMPMVWSFIAFIALIMTGLTIIAMNIWGPYMIEYKSFTDAFMSVLFIHMGLLNFEWMRYYESIWSFIFILFYSMCILCILMSSFMLFFIDSYRRVVLQKGSPIEKEPHQVPGSRYIRSWRQLGSWAMHGWVPQNVIKRVFGAHASDE